MEEVINRNTPLSERHVSTFYDSATFARESAVLFSIVLPPDLTTDDVKSALLTVPITSVMIVPDGRPMDSYGEEATLSLEAHRLLEPVSGVVRGYYHLAQVVDRRPDSTTRLTAELSGVRITQHDTMLSLNITTAVKAWLDGEPNHGLLVFPARFPDSTPSTRWSYRTPLSASEAEARLERFERSPASRSGGTLAPPDEREAKVLIWYR